jgi:hypothetical protein
MFCEYGQICGKFISDKVNSNTQMVEMNPTIMIKAKAGVK